MLITSKAIVLNAIKYGDYDLIVKCYTEQGLRSYMVKRIFKATKGKLAPAFFQPLTQLEITANYNSNRTLHFIKEAKISTPYTTIHNNVIKQTMMVFLSEVLSHALKEEEENQSLFSYLETAFQWLDNHSETPNFHLVFLMNLTKYLGFYPEKGNQFLYFDLNEGKFTNHIISNLYISGKNLDYFKALLGTNFDIENELKLNKTNRHELLEILIQYFELHLPGFRKPRSLEVLKAVFN
ncbi:DNA repair protein RecO [Aureibaculum luteum]|uniref:DNA repair protein RecO n=1 Tax=Aureibaculum luteum TaxID=1548456 RepID=UPI000E53367C|nr:DNA repair protein RecO [Aureibaculum luteum]